jgi:hypothetical protein
MLHIRVVIMQDKCFVLFHILACSLRDSSFDFSGCVAVAAVPVNYKCCPTYWWFSSCL